MNAVDVHNVTKVFPNGTRALHDVSLSVPEGQMIALVGLSGSGKSTLLRHLNGLLLPTSGTVRTLSTDVGGASRRELRELRRDVGFVFQQFGLVGRISAMENVLSGALGSLKGPRFGVSMYPKALRRQALENLDRVGLADQAFQRADTLSGGQMQRVAIARSLMQSPKLLLADEPVASLDPESSSQVMDILFRIVIEDQLTVICTLHQVELAMGWAKRIVGLRDGVVVLDQLVSDIEQSDVMEVYRRVEPEGSPQELTIIDKSSSTGVSHP
jgi:phosphonate transport system ATP-binding protein